MKKLYFDKVAILGTGLIGASFALAMKENKLCSSITGFGRKKENLTKAKDKGIIDSFEEEPAGACKDADLILLATPVGTFIDLIKKCIPSLKAGALITDVGSVKGRLVYEIEKIIPEGVHYVGGHPIAGSDRSGIDSSSAELFRNAKCIITPTENSQAEALETIIDLWKSVGSRVITLDPEQHDRIYASVSHLPHIISYAIVNTVGEIDSSYLEFCGQGFRDTTRIASSSPELWRDICLLNRDNLNEIIAVFQKKLETLSQYLRAYDTDSLEREFRKAQSLRDGIGHN